MQAQKQSEESTAMKIFGTILRTLSRLFRAIWSHTTSRRVFLVFAALVVLWIALLIYRPSHRLSMTVEAGEELPDPVTVTGQSDASYLNSRDADLSVPGIYKLQIKTGAGKYYLRLKVRDTVAPEGDVKHLYWGIGTSQPEGKEFFSEIRDATDVTVTYTGLDNVGSYVPDKAYPVEILMTDAGGNETKYTSTVTLIEDNTPPTVTVHEISGYIGYGISYSKGVTATDNCCGALTVTWDASKVKPDQVGVYPVIYTVTDASGRSTTVEGVIYIYEEEITPEMLFVRVDRVLDEIITVDMTVEQRVRAVYRFVYDHISYAGSSDKSDWMQEAYYVLESGSGDCFSYFALAKAFFERMGLENLDIQRTTGLTPDRHYWNFVNIGTKDQPRWYYFDATHLNTTGTGGEHSGCLLTEKQIMAYNKVRAHFYTYDHTGYPTASTEIITPTPSLEPYY